MATKIIYNMIVAFDKERGIGNKNTLPWHFSEDLKRFSKLTKGSGNNAIVMGKNTWNSLPKKPLPNRDNLILSTTLQLIPNNSIKIFSNTTLLQDFCNKQKYDTVWIIGGSQVYKELITELDINLIYVTLIHDIYNCDTFFPILNNWEILTNEHTIIGTTKLSYQIYKKIV
jgi:dihydrofolate reductase